MTLKKQTPEEQRLIAAVEAIRVQCCTIIAQFFQQMPTVTSEHWKWVVEINRQIVSTGTLEDGFTLDEYVKNEAERLRAASQPAEREGEPFAYTCPASCGCLWRDNKDGTMSLFGKSSQSCEVCEPLPLSKLMRLYTIQDSPDRQHPRQELADADARGHASPAYPGDEVRAGSRPSPLSPESSALPGPCGKHPRKIAETPSQAWYRAYESVNADKDPSQHCPECDRESAPSPSNALANEAHTEVGEKKGRQEQPRETVNVNEIRAQECDSLRVYIHGTDRHIGNPERCNYSVCCDLQARAQLLRAALAATPAKEPANG